MRPGQSMECEEGCECVIPEGKGIVRTLYGITHIFCCPDCADVFQESLTLELAEVLRRRVSAGLTVVDMGCGPGYYTQLLRDLVGTRGNVYAVDADPARVQQAERHLECRFRPEASEWVHFLRSTRSIREGSVDLILSNNVLCCMRDRWAEVREMRRMIRPDGLAYVRVNDVAVKDITPIEDREWSRLFGAWTSLNEGTAGTVRWKLMTRPTS